MINSNRKEIAVKLLLQSAAYFNDLGVHAEYEYDYGDGWLHKIMLEGYLYR
jgi:hypothetical protein